MVTRFEHTRQERQARLMEAMLLSLRQADVFQSPQNSVKTLIIYVFDVSAFFIRTAQHSLAQHGILPHFLYAATFPYRYLIDSVEYSSIIVLNNRFQGKLDHTLAYVLWVNEADDVINKRKGQTILEYRAIGDELAAAPC